MTQESEIKKPSGNLSPNPDSFTATSPDYTAETAASRILHIDFKWFRYGTNDQTHAAALILSVLLLLVSFMVICAGIVLGILWEVQSTWLDRAFTWLSGAFLMIAGVAIGKSLDNK